MIIGGEGERTIEECLHGDRDELREGKVDGHLFLELLCLFWWRRRWESSQGYTLLLLFDVDPLSLQLQTAGGAVAVGLAGMGTDKANIASIGGRLLILARVP